MSFMYAMMGWIVAIALLAIVFIAGVVLLILSLVTRARAKRDPTVQRSPKVLMAIALPMLLLPVLVSVVLMAYGTFSIVQDFNPQGKQYVQLQEKMENKVQEVLVAAEANDVDTLYNLFSDTSRQNDPDLKEALRSFLQTFPGDPDSIEYLITMTDGVSMPIVQTDVASDVVINGKFILTKDGTNYYCQLIFCLSSEKNPEYIGIHNLALQSELAASRDAYWYPYPEDWMYTKTIFANLEKDEAIDTRCIEGLPVIFEQNRHPITEKELYDFLAESTSQSDFIAAFGEPNAVIDKETYYYELESSGSKRYIKMIVEEGSDQISIESSIISESGTRMRSLLEERKMGDEEP